MVQMSEMLHHQGQRRDLRFPEEYQRQARMAEAPTPHAIRHSVTYFGKPETTLDKQS